MISAAMDAGGAASPSPPVHERVARAPGRNLEASSHTEDSKNADTTSTHSPSLTAHSLAVTKAHAHDLAVRAAEMHLEASRDTEDNGDVVQTERHSAWSEMHLP